MFGIGKKRSPLGKFLDKNSISVTKYSKESNVNRNTLGRACNDPNFIPSPSIMKKILSTAKKIDPNKKMSDFWDM